MLVLPSCLPARCRLAACLPAPPCVVSASQPDRLSPCPKPFPPRDLPASLASPPPHPSLPPPRTATIATGTASTDSVQQGGVPSESFSAVQVSSFALPTAGLWLGGGVALNQAGAYGAYGYQKATVNVNGKVVTSGEVLGN